MITRNAVVKHLQAYNDHKDIMMFYKIFVQIIALCFAYDFKCPESAQWYMRSKLLCQNPAKYSCLHNDFARGGFSENCSIVALEPAGRIIILRGGKDAGDCRQNRYQPAGNLYRTNISTDCIYFKSLCTEEGQVVHREDPAYTSDTTCRCDYTKGYDFVTMPNNRCYCIPSQEDCSCYLKRCSDTLHILSPDYNCIDKAQTNLFRSCSVLAIKIKVTGQIWNMTHIQDERDTTMYWKYHRFTQEKWKEYLVVLSVFCVIATVGMCLTIRYFPIWKAQFTSDLKVVTEHCMEGHTVILQCKTNGGKGEVNWEKDGDKIDNPKRIVIREQRAEHTLTIKDATLGDSGKYTISCGKAARCLEVKITEMPAAIRLLSKEDKMLYMDIIKSGTETRYYIRIVIIGENGVGKTCLLRRLLKQSTTGVQSTDGIDIHRCKIRLTDGEWVFDEGNHKMNMQDKVFSEENN